MQNDIASGRLFAFESDVRNTETNYQTRMKQFVTWTEALEAYRFANYVGAELIYGEEIVDPEIGALKGPGLVQQILPENKFVYSIGDLARVSQLEYVLKVYRERNPNVYEVDLILGDESFAEIQASVKKVYNIRREEAPRRTPEEAMVPYSAGPELYDTFIDIFGVKANIINMRSMSAPFLSGRNHPKSRNSIRSGDMILLDMKSSLQNLNLDTAMFQGGVDKKINLLTAMNPDGTADDFSEQVATGKTDAWGNMRKSGEPGSLGPDREDIIVSQEVTIALELADRESAQYWSIDNN
jgi:hypothetical protein